VARHPSNPERDRHGAPRPRRARGLIRILLRWTLLLGLAAALVGVLYGIHLDRVVKGKFEGKRWALPARVYARPLELYVGRALTPEQLRDELARLSYREASGEDDAGTYAMDGDRFLVHTRGFRFWDGEEPERLLDVQFADGRVEALDDVGGGPEPDLARLDPVLIASIYPTHHEDRVLVRRRDLPDLLVKALLAVEDRNFYEHFGVDPRGIARAFYRNLRAGSVVEGASTLTQQLVKNFYLSSERTFKRKLNEAYMAFLLERRYSKDEILEAYANEIYLGQDGDRAIHGFGLASSFYFNRSLKDLGIPEVALLVGLVQAPAKYDPRRHPKAARARRDLVLDVMARDDVITDEQARQAKAMPLGLRDGGGRPAGTYPGFIQLVRRQLQRDYREEDLRSEGLRIFTTLDPLIQETVEHSVPTKLAELEKKRRMKPGTLESAAVVASVAQGEVLALVDGREPGYAGFNRALDAVRSIGSLVKPAVYLTALSDPSHYTLTTRIQDRPYSLRTGDGKLWSPKNYDHRVRGPVPLYRGLASSLNLATVNLGMSIGRGKVAETLYRLGAQRRIKAVPAMLLGAVSLSPLEVAQMYQTIAAGGYRAPLRAIRAVMDQDGRPLNRYPLAVQAAVDPRADYLVTWAMQQVVKQGTAKWLGARLPEGLTMAGKTGTTDDMRDSWFAGFSGDKVAVVWVGRDDYKPMGLAGGTGALRVWGDFMLALPNEPLPQAPPEGVVVAKSGIPYVEGTGPAAAPSSATAAAGGGGDGSETVEGDSERLARAGSGSADKPTPPPKPEKKSENFFLEMF